MRWPAITVRVFVPGSHRELRAELGPGPGSPLPSSPAWRLFPALLVASQEEAGWTKPKEECSLENTNPFSCFPLETLARAQNLYIFFLVKKNSKPALVTHTVKSEAADREPSEHPQPWWPPASERAGRQHLRAHARQVPWWELLAAARGPGAEAANCPLSSRRPLLEEPRASI